MQGKRWALPQLTSWSINATRCRRQRREARTSASRRIGWSQVDVRHNATPIDVDTPLCGQLVVRVVETALADGTERAFHPKSRRGCRLQVARLTMEIVDYRLPLYRARTATDAAGSPFMDSCFAGDRARLLEVATALLPALP